jgi:hypothetical protein
MFWYMDVLWNVQASLNIIYFFENLLFLYSENIHCSILQLSNYSMYYQCFSGPLSLHPSVPSLWSPSFYAQLPQTNIFRFYI